jgi:hypothetical protein
LTNNKLSGGSIFESVNVTADLDCDTASLFYRQCIRESVGSSLPLCYWPRAIDRCAPFILANFRRCCCCRRRPPRAVPVQMTIILIAVGSVVFVGGITLILFCCGCCKCCNRPGDESKWGMCNRFCPWCPFATRPEKESDTPSWMANPVTEEENTKSLFGKNKSLSSAPPPGGGEGAGSGSSTGIAMTAASVDGRGGGGGLHPLPLC